MASAGAEMSKMVSSLVWTEMSGTSEWAGCLSMQPLHLLTIAWQSQDSQASYMLPCFFPRANVPRDCDGTFKGSYDSALEVK